MISEKLHKTYRKYEKPLGSGFSCVGGAEENRTPVRKQIRQPFYTLSLSFEIPSQHSDKQDC